MSRALQVGVWYVLKLIQINCMEKEWLVDKSVLREILGGFALWLPFAAVSAMAQSCGGPSDGECVA